jgi:phospholipid N-methyltransferase
MTAPKKKDLIDQIEEFYSQKVGSKVKKEVLEFEAKLKERVGKLEKVLKKEIKIPKGKNLFNLEYDPDSPLSYLAAFMRDKGVTAVMPSSGFIVRRVIKAMNLSKCKVVVEFGPAEGVMTRQILKHLPKDGHLVAIELNEDFIKALRRIKDPRLHAVHGNVMDVAKILKDLGLEGADAVTSGIPFSFFNPRQRHQLLEKIEGLLKSKGRFVAYQFTTHLIPLLKCYFSKVDTQFEVRNIPPHFVFTCHK